ncbi:MAG: hypothetical protein D6738_07885 [Acidobacteria bacterium]|nr:MAG: hypothetical protein D6738_07885 [Acidobacteriota bacterium]
MRRERSRGPIRVGFAGRPDPGVTEALEALGGVACEVVDDPAGDLAALARRVDVLVTRSSHRVDASLLGQAADAGLRAVVQASSGADNIDRVRAAEVGVEVVQVDPGNATAVAELTLLGLLAAFRGIRRYWDDTPRGVWPDRERVDDRELRGRTLGLVGLGRVGSRVALRARAFEMRVLAVDPYVPDERFRRFGAERVEDLPSMCPRLDALSLHCPLTDETVGMVDRDVFDLLPRGAVLVNTARGAIVEQRALREALDGGRLRAAVLDVHVPEPVEPGGLAAHPRVLATPHIAGHTVDSHAARARALTEALVTLVRRLAGGEGGR